MEIAADPVGTPVSGGERLQQVSSFSEVAGKVSTKTRLREIASSSLSRICGVKAPTRSGSRPQQRAFDQRPGRGCGVAHDIGLRHGLGKISSYIHALV
jgi:hypothetical protein